MFLFIISIFMGGVLIYCLLLNSGNVGNKIASYFKLDNRGELDLGGKDTFTADEVKTLVEKQIDTLVQPKIDNIVQTRLAQQAKKFEGYDDLVKFKSEHETQTAADEKKKLEDQGKYDEALKTVNIKVDDLNNVILTKDNTINAMMIGSALTNEIVLQGGYLEESLAMLKASAELKDGVVTIKGKDANGLDQSFSVTDGVKSFLANKPHLIKAKTNAGGGDTGGGTGQAGQGSADDLTTLNDLLVKQSMANDFKGAQETRDKIKTLMASSGKTIAVGVT